LPIYYDLNPSNNGSFHDYKDTELLIEATLKEGYELAKKTLRKEMKLLLHMSDYLSDNSSIDKDNLKQMIVENKVSDLELIENGDLLYYRNHLKKTISKQGKSPLLFEGISMNHNIK
jgi:cell division protease FtsH